jgi:hypothetical protein
LIAILATASVTASVTAGVLLLPSVFGPKPDFIFSSFPLLYLQASGQDTTLISIQAIRNFTGVLTVTVSPPAGLKTALQDPQTGQPKDQILLGKTGNLSLAVQDWQKVGYFSVAVTASSGAISHTQNLLVIVQNLTITPIGGSQLRIPRGSGANVELDLVSVNGLSANVSFLAQVYGNSCAHVSCPSNWSEGNVSFNPTSIIQSPGRVGQTTLTINVAQSDSSSVLDVVVFATTKQSWYFHLFLQVTVIP